MSTVLTLQQLTDSDLESYYTLRLKAFANELGWTASSVSSIEEMRDDFDGSAHAFGVFNDNELRAAIRVITAPSPEYLPSSQYIPPSYLTNQSVAELSKGVVSEELRGKGVFSMLLLHGSIKAMEHGIKHIFVTVIDTPRYRRFLNRCGFDVIASGFLYRDKLFSPKETAMTLRLKTEHSLNSSLLSNLRDHLLKSADITLI